MPKKQIFRDVHGKEFYRPKGARIRWRPSGYVLVLNNKKELLVIVPPWAKVYCLPGGQIKPSERIVPGVERECRQETGRRIRISSPDPFYSRDEYFYWRKKPKKPRYYHSVVMIYRGTLVDTGQKPSSIDRQEVRKVKWVPLREFNEENCQWAFWPAIRELQHQPQP